MSGLLNIGVTAALAAGKIILQGFGQLERINIYEKSSNNFVSDIDRKSENSIIDAIEKAFPSHSIIAEESGAKKGDDCKWIIDPLDGTNNFIHGFPHFSISIAIQIRGIMEHAIIFDPLRNDLYTATRGSGAQLNSQRIRVSNKPSLETCLLGTGCPFYNPEKVDEYLSKFRAMMLKSSGIRRTGSAALDLAFVASGKLDGFWQAGLKIWDIAAGSLLIQEAGGIANDFNGKTEYLESGKIVAANSKVLPEMLSILNSK